MQKELLKVLDQLDLFNTEYNKINPEQIELHRKRISTIDSLLNNIEIISDEILRTPLENQEKITQLLIVLNLKIKRVQYFLNELVETFRPLLNEFPYMNEE